MTAHGLNPRIHTIARIRNPEYGKQIFTMRDVYSLSLMVNPEKQAAREIERLIRYPGFLQRETFAKSRVEIVELRIQKGSKLCDVALMNLDNVVKCKVLVCAVSRGGVVEIPSGHFILREGDHLFITATAEMLTQLLRNLGIITHKAKRVIICGGGRIGYYLSTWLAKEGVSVLLIEQDEADYTAGVNWIRERYQIQLILVSMGKEGSRAYYNGTMVEVKPFLQKNTIETTGAGDTFCVCVLHYICEHGMEGLDENKLKEMLTFANAAASVITTRKGALRVMPTRDEIQKTCEM